MLGESVRKAIQLVDETKAPSKEETVFSSTSLLQERFFIRLVNNLFENEEEFLLQKEELSVSFSENGSLAGFFLIDTPTELTMDSKQLLNLYNATLHMFIQLIAKYMTCDVTPLDARHFLIVFPLSAADGDSWKQEILHALDGTCSMLKNYYNTSIRAGLGHPVKNPFELSGSFYAAKQALTETCRETPFLFYDELKDAAASKNVFNLAIFKDDI